MAKPCRRRCLPSCRLLGVSTTIRVSEQTRDRLAALSESTGLPMTKVVDDAVDALERRVFFDRLNDRYRQLRDDPELSAEIDAERVVEEGGVGDVSR